jgi:hypothetical protein
MMPEKESPKSRQQLQLENERLQAQVLSLQLRLDQHNKSLRRNSYPHLTTVPRRNSAKVFSPSPMRSWSEDDKEQMESQSLSCSNLDSVPQGGLHHRKSVNGTTPGAHALGNRTLPLGFDTFTSTMEEAEADPCPPAEGVGHSTFLLAVQDRAGWLVGLLVLQSMSSFIISRNEALLKNHLVIVQFLTMLVGAGGNAGNQASVGGKRMEWLRFCSFALAYNMHVRLTILLSVIRGLATGSVNDSNVRAFLRNEAKMGFTLSAILGVAGCLRAAVFQVPLLETLAITTSLCAIVFISIILGSILPLVMRRAGIDPAHSSTTIQVIMDITGVTITVCVSSFVLDSVIFKAWVFGSLPL